MCQSLSDYLIATVNKKKKKHASIDVIWSLFYNMLLNPPVGS